MKSLFYACGFILIVLACDNTEENYPIEPSIENAQVKFIDTGLASIPDTLKLSFDLRDGDFDLGLSYQEANDPYHPFSVFLENNGVRNKVPVYYDDTYFVIQTNQTGKLVLFRHNTMPAAVLYKDYLIGVDLSRGNQNIVDNTSLLTEVQGKPYLHLNDSVLIERNPNFYNLSVDYLVEKSDGTFALFDWLTLYGLSYNGRFPLIEKAEVGRKVKNGPFDIIRNSKAKATLTYNMIGIGFQPLFKGKTIKLRISIKDRALHESNVIETTPIDIN